MENRNTKIDINKSGKLISNGKTFINARICRKNAQTMNNTIRIKGSLSKVNFHPSYLFCWSTTSLLFKISEYDILTIM
jgi:hypothetical protein